MDENNDKITVHRFTMPLEGLTEEEHTWISQVARFPDQATLESLTLVHGESIQYVLREKTLDAYYKRLNWPGFILGQHRDALTSSANVTYGKDSKWVCQSLETGGTPYALARVLYGLACKFRPNETFKFEYIRLDDSLVYAGGGGAYKINKQGIEYIDTKAWMNDYIIIPALRLEGD